MSNINEQNGPVAEAERIIAQANRIHRANKRVAVFVLVVVALLVGLNWPKPADAAPLRGTVQVRYDVSSQWNVPAAVKAAGVGSVRVVKARPSNLANCGKNCVIVFSDPYVSHTDCNGFSPTTNARIAAATRRPAVVCRYGSQSDVQLGDRVTRSWTPAQRHAALVKAIRQATGR